MIIIIRILVGKQYIQTKSMKRDFEEETSCADFFASERPATESRLKVWVKPPQSGIESLGPCIYSSILHKKGKRLKMWVARRYCLYENVFVYCDQKNPNVIKGSINLDFIKCSFRIKAQKKQYGFTLSSGTATAELFTEDASIFEEWQKHLRGRVVLDDFHAKYKTGKLIGKGSYGRVYLAQRMTEMKKSAAEKNEEQLKPMEKAKGAQFAVKMLEKARLKGRSKDMLVNEIKILRELSHENITRLYELHEMPHAIYLIMNVIEGGELMHQIRAKGFYSEADCAKILKKLLETVDYIHSKGIIHRDLKPENILLKDSFDMTSVVIADFGLSCYKSDAKMLNLRCGTPGYVAPEILNNQKSDENLDKIDVFSLGCIFYKLLTGNSPFFAPTAKEAIRLNKECEINYESFLLSHMSLQAKSLLEKMLAKDPSKRVSIKEALNHEFFALPELDLAENIIDIGKLVSTYCSSHIFDLKGIKNKIQSSGILLKMSLQSVGSFYACPLPMINGRISTLVDESSDEGNRTPKNIDSLKLRKRMSSFGGAEGNSPSNREDNFRVSLGLISTIAQSKLSTTYGAASPLHRLAVMKQARTNDNSPVPRTHSMRQVQKGGGFSDYVEQEKNEQEGMGYGSENFDDVDEEFDIEGNLQQLFFIKSSCNIGSLTSRR